MDDDSRYSPKRRPNENQHTRAGPSNSDLLFLSHLEARRLWNRGKLHCRYPTKSRYRSIQGSMSRIVEQIVQVTIDRLKRTKVVPHIWIRHLRWVFGCGGKGNIIRRRTFRRSAWHSKQSHQMAEYQTTTSLLPKTKTFAQ